MAGERGSARLARPWVPAALAFVLAFCGWSEITRAQAQGSPPPKKRLVCWTDDAGDRACGDAVPARYADREKKVIDSSGRTVKTIPGAPTAEQIAEREEQSKRDAAAQREADRQAAYDRALLATYARPEELASLRDNRLATLDTSIDLAEAAARRDSVSIAELRARVPAGQQPDARLRASIKTQESTLAETQRAVAELRRNRESVCATFTRDIRRFQELKFGTVAFDSPCPPFGAFEQKKERAVEQKKEPAPEQK